MSLLKTLGFIPIERIGHASNGRIGSRIYIKPFSDGRRSHGLVLHEVPKGIEFVEFGKGTKPGTFVVARAEKDNPRANLIQKDRSVTNKDIVVQLLSNLGVAYSDRLQVLIEGDRVHDGVDIWEYRLSNRKNRN